MLLVGIILGTGFIFGELATRIKMPKVTGYILAGLILHPDIIHVIPKDLGLNTKIIFDIALAFITFSVGGSLFLPKIKKLGKSISYITLCESEFAFTAVAIGLLATLPLFLHIPHSSWLGTFVPMSLLLASLASPTDPTATLAVIHEYKARGDVSSTILGVAAFDDALGIINYSIAVVAAEILIAHTPVNASELALRPLVVIFGGIALGVLFGLIFNRIAMFIKRETEGVMIVVIFALLAMCYGCAALLDVDKLLATMAMGVVVANFNPQREKIFGMLARYTEELIFVLFFTLSTMLLDFSLIKGSLFPVLLFFIFRLAGKFIGTRVGASLGKAPAPVRKYAAGGLIPQGGIVIGLALLMKHNPAFSQFGDFIISIIIGSTLVHEIVGPIFSKLSLVKAGEINR